MQTYTVEPSHHWGMKFWPLNNYRGVAGGSVLIEHTWDIMKCPYVLRQGWGFHCSTFLTSQKWTSLYNGAGPSDLRAPPALLLLDAGILLTMYYIGGSFTIYKPPMHPC